LRDPDDELMARAGEGDRAAWKALYVRHRDRVFRIALRFLEEEPSARDATQEVFISLFAHAKSYRPSGSFPSYLRRVTVNRCMNARASAHESHRAASGEAALQEAADPAPDAETRLQHEQTAAAVRGAIAALPPRQRMAVILSRFEGLSYEEIAATLECSISSVESLLYRARQGLVRSLGHGAQVFGD
jgi:RNA polymerase sigma-70 factor (ECF subfamily)